MEEVRPFDYLFFDITYPLLHFARDMPPLLRYHHHALLLLCLRNTASRSIGNTAEILILLMPLRRYFIGRDAAPRPKRRDDRFTRDDDLYCVFALRPY